MKHISSDVDGVDGLTLHVEIDNIVSNGTRQPDFSDDITFYEDAWIGENTLQGVATFTLDDFVYYVLIELAPIGGKLSQVKFRVYTEDIEVEPEVMNTTLGHIKITEI